MSNASASQRRDAPPSTRRLAVAAAAVCLGYFVGANIGLILRLPPATPSIVWPPNSILTATLLLTPPSRWWIYLLAALPAHLAAELPVISPVSLVLAFYATNCLEAVIGAIGFRMLSHAPTRFDTLPRVAAFIAAIGLVAPFLSSFADAAMVTLLRHESYWLVWQTRFFSNVLTALVLVPVIASAARDGWTRVRSARLVYRLEAALLAGALITVAAAFVTAPPGLSKPLLGSLHTPVALFIPCVLWATVRFGPAGASLSMLVTTLVLIWGATHGYGGFSVPPAPDSVLILQISLAVSAVPVLALAALIEERGRDRLALAERLRFEELLSRLSGAFVRLASNRMDEAFRTSLARVGQFLDVDRVALLHTSRDGQQVAVSHQWAAPGFSELPTNLPALFPWSVSQLVRERPVAFEALHQLPAEATADRTAFREAGIRSSLAVPLVAGGRVMGALSLATIGREHPWPAELVANLPLVAEVFANALARKESEDALRASEVLQSAILASLNSSVAVLDGEGKVIETNRVWARSAPDFGQADAGTIGVGQNYVSACRAAGRRGGGHAREAIVGIESVLGGHQPWFSFEYPTATGTGERWFSMSVVPLSRPEGGVVVSYTDVTERKRAELDAQQSRQELAHVTRVSAMGELTASLAHELNQPLTGILINAQAAGRLLDAPALDLGELRATLRDIVEDDRRAAEVIKRMRDLLRNGQPEMQALDLNAIVRDVLGLLGSDIVIRNVSVTLDLDEHPTAVHGDRVQLEQVLLNLLLNAMEAIAERPGGDRTVNLCTRVTDDGRSVLASVDDSGPGLPTGIGETLFEPFFTTKRTGMGMGLAIARSIIEAHGGKIWAENGSRGALFCFRLPRVTDGVAAEPLAPPRETNTP